MESKKITQFGTFTVVILLVVLIFIIVISLSVGLSDTEELIIFSSTSLIVFLSLLFFYKIDIEIDSVHISFKMGIGIFGKSYKISEIESCKPVKNSFIYGFGIHKIPNGWLYNVSGINSIELTFKNSAKRIRIGTNKSYEITEIINGLLNLNKEYTEKKYIPMKNSTLISKNIYFALSIGLIIALFIQYQSQPVKLDLKETQLEIKGNYGFPINYNDIALIDTINKMPNIEMRTNGFASSKVCKGNFRLTNVGSAILFINFNISPFVHIVLKNGQVIYINLKDHQSTIKIFDEIKSIIKHKQLSK